MPRENNNAIIVTLILIVLAAVLVFMFWGNGSTTDSPPNQTATTTTQVNTNWLTTTATGTDVSFQYPENLGTKYISTQDWPPQIQILNQTYTCLNAGTATATAGQTQEKNIGGITYCKTIESEGAAGSIYEMLAYAFPRGNQTLFLTFTIREVQCGNFDEPNATECATERSNFNPDSLAVQIEETVR